jgi:hypothetical protein
MRCVALCCCIVFAAFTSFAAGPPPEPKALKLEPRAWEGSKHLKVAKVEASADEKGERYVLTGLTTLRPVAIGVEGKNPGDVFTLRVFKSGWKDAKREVSTASQPLAVTEFRTYGDALILVTSASGKKPFVLRAIVGDEVRRPMKPAATPMDLYRQHHPEAFSPWGSPWVLGGAGLAAVLAGAFFFFKRRKP